MTKELIQRLMNFEGELRRQISTLDRYSKHMANETGKGSVSTALGCGETSGYRGARDLLYKYFPEVKPQTKGETQ